VRADGAWDAARKASGPAGPTKGKSCWDLVAEDDELAFALGRGDTSEGKV